MRYESIQERIIANSTPSQECLHDGTPCWEWLGKCRPNRSGVLYPYITRRITKGPRKGKVESALAHRVALRVFKKVRLMKRHVVMHLCNNTICVNPAHLARGSQKSNVQQCMREGRHVTPFRREIA